ncbi:MAG: MerR family transcriptional regulator [Nannocystaceae bacterium]
MSVRAHQVKEVARLSGVSVRTLHHYDAIGLLTPSARSAAGYRLYSDDDLGRLQQILIGKALGLSLEAIRASLDQPGYDRRQALRRQRTALIARRDEAEGMIRSIDAALRQLEGEGAMETNMKELFDGFDPAEHEDEAKARWGQTDAYRESTRRTRGYGPEEWAAIKAEGEALIAGLLAAIDAGARPEDEAATALAETHRLHIDRWFYPCDPAMHEGLAAMYTADARFRDHYDRHREGLAEFFAAAIRANSARLRGEG